MMQTRRIARSTHLIALMILFAKVVRSFVLRFSIKIISVATISTLNKFVCYMKMGEPGRFIVYHLLSVKNVEKYTEIRFEKRERNRKIILKCRIHGLLVLVNSSIHSTRTIIASYMANTCVYKCPFGPSTALHVLPHLQRLMEYVA